MSVYVISDTHFGHDNLITYCDRPFQNAGEMDAQIINQWNSTVDPRDTVLFGGDLAISSPQDAITYQQQLNGKFTLLTGNHDEFDKWRTPFPVMESQYFTYSHYGDEYEFYYSHWPAQYQARTTRDDNRVQPDYAALPSWFEGWNLHGHVHNNDLEKFPFVNHTQKTVNVGADLLQFTPLDMNSLVRILKQGESYETVADVPDDVYSVATSF